jgi:hypothetical protein
MIRHRHRPRRPQPIEHPGFPLSHVVLRLTRLPCGCRFAKQDDVLLFEPCSSTCDAYAYVIEQARKTGKPIDIDVAHG